MLAFILRDLKQEADLESYGTVFFEEIKVYCYSKCQEKSLTT